MAVTLFEKDIIGSGGRGGLFQKAAILLRPQLVERPYGLKPLPGTGREGERCSRDSPMGLSGKSFRASLPFDEMRQDFAAF
jgi:hypothetical protein